MAFRTLVIATHSKVEYSLNYLVFRTPDEIKRVNLDEVHTVIFESTEVAVTTSLLAELVNRKIKVVFCDEKHNPISELTPYYGCHNSTKRIIGQTKWTDEAKNSVWQRIIKRKIENQAVTLQKAKKDGPSKLLLSYAQEIEPGDPSNREGFAAKVYFNNVFYEGFTRDDESFQNACLDYGYTILLGTINRCVVSLGCLTQLGIHHKGEFNPFNLSSDLIEPLRFLVDEKTMTLQKGDNFKDQMVSLLGEEVSIKGKSQTLSNAIPIYVQSVVDAIEGNSEIAFIDKNDP